ncbi:CotD family spore coat protein [Pseudogracilibacillus sp. SE30717A]|uniref:CotD family spore coat protein n=1 Tax=Pseudogracilibacillus sp. SE30717A TaxID=3098293 RepID=UPI00300DD3A8
MSNCGCKGKCQCGNVRDIVYPTRKEVKCTYSNETVRHIRPSHTKVINNHTIRNEHLFPHSTSFENRVREVDVRGVSEGPGRGVGGFGDYNNNVRGASYDGRVAGAGYGQFGCGCRSRCRCRRRRGWF